MTAVLIKHKVENYDKWKSAFDGFIEARKSGGEKGYQIFRPVDDPDRVTIIFDWENDDSAKAFLASDALKQAMQNAGVTEEPEISLMTRTARGEI